MYDKNVDKIMVLLPASFYLKTPWITAVIESAGSAESRAFESELLSMLMKQLSEISHDVSPMIPRVQPFAVNTNLHMHPVQCVYRRTWFRTHNALSKLSLCTLGAWQCGACTVIKRSPSFQKECICTAPVTYLW